MPKTPEHSGALLFHNSHFSAQQIIKGVAAKYPETSSFTFTYEGGYVNDPDDPGGCTNMGITIGTLGAWRGEAVSCDDVKALTKLEAQLIYATDYWAPVWGNQLPVGVNTQVYDWGVNSGPSTAIKHMQRIIGSPDDGVMGNNTLNAVLDYCDKESISVLISAMQLERQDYYESLSTFSKYGNGWTTRNNDCTALALDLCTTGGMYVPPTGELEKRVAALEEWAGSYNA